MTIAGLQAQLATEFGSVAPPYTASDIRERMARAVHAGVGTVVTFSATHGVQATIADPGGTARGFTVLEAYDGSGNPMSVVGTPKINRLVGGGNLGITVEYDLRHAEPLIVRSHSVAQSLPHTTTTDLAFDTLHESRGGVISYGGTGTFTFSEAGTYLVSAKVYFEQLSYLGTQIRIFGGASATVQLDNYLPASMNPGPVMSGSTVVPAAAGSTVKVQAWQQNSGGVGRFAMGNATASRATHVKIHRLYNDTAPVGTVRGILWDG